MKPTALHRVLGPLCAAAMLAACQAPAALPPVTATLTPGAQAPARGAAMKLRVALAAAPGCRTLQATDLENWSRLNVSYITFQVFDTSETGTALTTPEHSLDVTESSLENNHQVTINNLKPNTTYRVEARAYYDPPGTAAPVPVSRDLAPATGWKQTITVGEELETPLDTDLTLELVDKVFDGKTNLAGIVSDGTTCVAELIGAVSTVAGTDLDEADDDYTFVAGEVGKLARLGVISDLAYRKADNSLYAALYDQHCVVRIDAATRSVHLVAGKYGEAGASVGGVATDANLSNPAGLAFDEEELSLYVTEHGNDRIVGINLAPATPTIALAAGPDDDAIADAIASDETVDGYLDDGLTGSRFDDPSGLVHLPEDGLVVVDRGNHVIRKIFSATVSTIAGDRLNGGNAGNTGFKDADVDALQVPLDGPVDIAIHGPSDGLVFTDRGYRAVRRLYKHATGWGLATVMTDAEGEINGPTGIAVDARGRVWVGDEDSDHVDPAVRMIPAGTIAATASDPTGFLGRLADLETWIHGRPALVYYADGGREDFLFDDGDRSNSFIPLASDALGRIYFGDEGARSLRLLQ